MTDPKVPRKATKRELETMISQIEKGDSIAVFNAQKALYIYIDKWHLREILKLWMQKNIIDMEEFHDN